MATMYSLFFGLLFIALCSDNGDGSSVLSASMPAHGIFILLDQNEAKNQGLVARLNCLLISGNKTNSPDKSGSNKSDCLSEIIDNSLRLAQPRPIYSGTARSSLQSRLMSPVKILTIAMGGTNVRSGCSSDDFCFFLGKIAKQSPKETRSPSGDEDMKIKGDEILFAGIRQSIIAIASKELGTHEATGNNDGPRIEQYLHYTNLGKGYEWCAAFVSWCYGQAGLNTPRNPWSPALFPKARQIDKVQAMPADVFGIYGVKAKRINHVGLVKKLSKDYLVTIEGNSNDRVESRRRHLRTIYTIADWVNE